MKQPFKVSLKESGEGLKHLFAAELCKEVMMACVQHQHTELLAHKVAGAGCEGEGHILGHTSLMQSSHAQCRFQDDIILIL